MNRILDLVTKVAAVVGVSALIDYALIFLLRGPILLVIYAATFLLKPMVTLCLIVLTAKLVILSAMDILKYDWGIRLNVTPVDRDYVLRDVAVLVLLVIALTLYYRYSTRQ